MTEKELGAILQKMYDTAPPKDKVTMIHVFGIKYAKEISHSCSIKSIVKESGISTSYVTEVSKGVRLASYVCLK